MKRGVAIALGASALFHGSLLLVLDGPAPRARPRAIAPRAGRAPVAATAAPIDVTMVVMPAAAAAHGPTGAASRFRTRATIATAPAAGTDPTGTTATAGEPIAPSGPGRLSMRLPGRPGRLDLSPHRQHLTVADDPDAPPPWTPPAPSGELDPAGGGRHRTDRPGFVGKVAADGSVSFKDKPAFSIKLALPDPVAIVKGAARSLEHWYRDPWEQVRLAERDRLSGVEVGDYTPSLDADGKPRQGGVTFALIEGKSEITDYVMQKVGMDPYQSDKLRWMEATREERVEISRLHRRRQLGQSDHLVRRHLETLWARTDLDLAAKREALFELWDDGAEDGDAAVVEAASRSRAHVIGFVRAHLPAGSPDAYTDAELALFNRRRTSRARFAPY